jgi:alpha-tubulin suppressor-like RCC1 family protein
MMLRKLVIAGAGLCAAGAATLVAGCSAQGHVQRLPEGTIEHWGSYGIATVRQFTPARLRVPAPVAEVSSSNSTEYALLTNGTVYALGLGTDGQLGNGHRANSFNVPVQVKFPAGVKIASIPTDVMPYNSGFAVDTRGRVWAWGANAGGEFCLGNIRRYIKPVMLPFRHVSTLAGADNHATYDAGGTIYSCGQNQFGELGDGTKLSSTTPVKVIGLGKGTVTSLVAAWGDTGAVLSDGAYFDWGFNLAGQLGDGIMRKPSDVPFRVPLPGPVTQAAQGGSVAGNGQTLVLLSDGSLYAWGTGAFYQLGDGTRANQDRPVRILPPAGVTYRAVATGGNTSYAISTAGKVYAWGNGNVGQVGAGGITVAVRPIEVQSRATTISSTANDVVVSLAGADR